MPITELRQHLDNICTYLTEGENWHRRSANECRKNMLRGWGRWHDAEGICDAKSHFAIAKIAIDSPAISYEPAVDLQTSMRAVSYTIPYGPEGLKRHHEQWLDRENRFIAIINMAIQESRNIDLCLYEELLCLGKEVQNEAMRVKMVEGRITLANYNGHDIGILSMVLHSYFEAYDGGVIDFNLG